MTQRCRFLEWDSRFFQRRIARLEGGSLDLEDIAPVLDWCAREKIECLYFLADAGCAPTMAAAESAGFLFKDLRVTYQWSLAQGLPAEPSNAPAHFLLRPFRAADFPCLAPLARASHTDTRFFFDRRFGQDAAAALYEEWLRKAGEGAGVFVGEIAQTAVAYITAQITPDGSGEIGLLAVGPAFQGQGVARALIHTALDWLAAQGATRVTVVTQGRNVSAQRFYQGCGFRMQSCQAWHHKWFIPTHAGGASEEHATPSAPLF